MLMKLLLLLATQGAPVSAHCADAGYKFLRVHSCSQKREKDV
ncbi:hypothetical protein A2U01_0104353, partial [Trifolium medium]|nr:hypothetical protein [Trifolium medium]